MSIAERYNVLSRRADEERFISPRRRRAPYLTERLKNVLSRRANEERHISLYTGHVLAVKAPKYDVLRPRGKIGRSSIVQ